MLSGTLLFILVILTGVLLVVSVIFMIIAFANSYKSKFVWLVLFIISFVGVIFCVYLLVTKIANKAAQFGSTLAHNSYQVGTTETYNLADSTNSKQIDYLKAIEPLKYKGAVPAQFYHYLGFGHYYRMPLVYPFSLHCEDRLDKASLFSESKVVIFIQSDNGEESCNVDGITDFEFDDSLLVAKVNKRDFETNEDSYLIYHFFGGKKEVFKSLEEASDKAKQLRFSKPVKLVSCAEYYNLLK